MDQTPNELPLEALADRNVGIKLVGVGGGGSNAVDRLKMENLDRLQLAVINTDFKALSTSPVQDKILIGTSLTRGLSAGGDPELGRKAAEADADKIAEIVKDTDLVFIVAGLGGGTGSGAAPVVAELAAEAGAVVIAFVTLPFSFEGGRRRKQAEEALAELRRVCDAVIPLANDMLLQEGTEQTSVLDSFARADEWIGRGVKSIWAMLSRTGLINVDFTALRQVFQQRGGKTLFGLGVGDGRTRGSQAMPAAPHAGIRAQGRPPARQHHRRRRSQPDQGQRADDGDHRGIRPRGACRDGRGDRRRPAGPGRDLRHRHHRPGQPQLYPPAWGPAHAESAGEAARRDHDFVRAGQHDQRQDHGHHRRRPRFHRDPPNQAQAGGIRLPR
jgi:cell division protein FtsZ